MITIKNVLVATDFSPEAENALTYGRALARTFGGALHVLHVVDDFTAHFMYADASVPGFEPVQVQAEMEALSMRRLDALVREDDRRELRATPVLRVNRKIADEIVDYATRAAIDVIVIGATGRGAVDRFFMGSVADKVIRRAPCPVLAVRSPEHEFVAPDSIQAATKA